MPEGKGKKRNSELERKEKMKGNIFLSFFLGLDPINELPISERIKSFFRGFYPFVLMLHVLGIVLSIYLIKTLPANGTRLGNLIVFINLFGAIQIITNFVILRSSIMSEALLRQTYEFASSTTRASTHKFNSFEDHLLWIKNEFNHLLYPNQDIHLYMSVSTPIYGLAEDIKSADIFLSYLEEWIEHFEKMPESNPNPPIWELCIWRKEAHLKVFSVVFSPDQKTEQKYRLRKFARLCERIYSLDRNGRVDCRLYFSHESHTRWFFLKTGDQQYTGLIVIFSPLSPSAIETHRWSLVGISFRDREGFMNLTPFNYNLQHEDHHGRRINKIELFKDPWSWIKDHYGMATDLLIAEEGESLNGDLASRDEV